MDLANGYGRYMWYILLENEKIFRTILDMRTSVWYIYYVQRIQYYVRYESQADPRSFMESGFLHFRKKKNPEFFRAFQTLEISARIPSALALDSSIVPGGSHPYFYDVVDVYLPAFRVIGHDLVIN